MIYETLLHTKEEHRTRRGGVRESITLTDVHHEIIAMCREVMADEIAISPDEMAYGAGRPRFVVAEAAFVLFMAGLLDRYCAVIKDRGGVERHAYAYTLPNVRVCRFHAGPLWAPGLK